VAVVGVQKRLGDLEADASAEAASLQRFHHGLSLC
jgi:hypothetical protein